MVDFEHLNDIGRNALRLFSFGGSRRDYRSQTVEFRENAMRRLIVGAPHEQLFLFTRRL
jgi:hypothetical protein